MYCVKYVNHLRMSDSKERALGQVKSTLTTGELVHIVGDAYKHTGRLAMVAATHVQSHQDVGVQQHQRGQQLTADSQPVVPQLLTHAQQYVVSTAVVTWQHQTDILTAIYFIYFSRVHQLTTT